jgi:uncharacterized protein
MSEEKLIKLDSILRDLGSFVVGFSGGLDSSFLIHRAGLLKDVRFTAVTIHTEYVPEREIRESKTFSSEYKINHVVIEVPFPDEIRNNPSDRCYLCKKTLFGKIVEYARNNGYRYVADGTNADDKNDFRPGLRALSEMNIRSPLAVAGLSKKEIRELAHNAGLSIWDKPAMACLLTRIPYDTEISEGMLRMIEKAEDYLFEKGFPGTRVRVHGDIARIECIPGYLTKLVNDPDIDSIVSYLKNIGFRYISLDLEGYRTGSMNPINPLK